MTFSDHRAHTTHTHTHTHSAKEHMKALSKETPRAPSQEDPITPCASIKMVPPSALWLPIAISSPQWVPTQAAQVRLYNWPPETQHNGVNYVYAPDKKIIYPYLMPDSPHCWWAHTH